MLRRLTEAGLKLDVRILLQISIQYLGYTIDDEGLHPIEKVKDIQDALVQTMLQN